MGYDIVARLREFVKKISTIFKNLSSNKDLESVTPDDSVPCVPPQILPSVSLIRTRFDISEAADKLDQSGEFHYEKFRTDQMEESWAFKKPITLLGKDQMIQIEVTIRYDKDLLTFIMPMYEEGSEGLTGDKIEIFNALIHQFNSRTTVGYFTKDTSEESYALVFTNHFPLSRMDFDWFKSILNQFVTILSGFRPLLDQAISNLGLKFNRSAGLEDPARIYLEERKKEYILLGETKH